MKRVWLMLVAFVLFGFVPTGNAQYPLQYDASFEFHLFTPSKIVVQYAYTEHFSVSNITTLGYSLWTEVGSPVGVEFIAKEVDTYEFNIIIGYDETIDQTVQIGVWSGSLPPHSISKRFVADEIVLHFKLTLTEEPRPPTPDEVAQASLLMTQQELRYFTDQITLLTRQFEQNLLTQWIVIAACAVNSIFSLIVAVYVFRRKVH